MYIRVKSTPNSPRKSLQIVEGTRDPNGKVKQTILRHLGVIHNEKEEAALRAYAEEVMAMIRQEREAASLQPSLFPSSHASAPARGRPKKKRLEDILPPSQVTLDDVEEVDRLIEGVHEVGGHMFHQLGFDQLLPHKRDSSLLEDVVLARLLAPESKRGLQKMLSTHCHKDYSLDAIYRMMDKLHPQIPRLKELCFQATRRLFPETQLQMVFFDVTTLYFESIEVDELRAYGYSKDHRFNTTQLVLALATNEEGLPLGYELFKGNTAEVKTLLAALKSWEPFLPIRDVCFVADRALFAKENLELLEASGYRYIVAAKLRTLPHALQEQVLAEDTYTPTVLGDQLAWMSDLPYGDRRLITSYKASRAMHDQKKRAEVIAKITKTLGSKEKGDTKKLISNAGVKRYTSFQNSEAHLDETKIAQESLWDGLHGIITNDKEITPAEALARYARLWVIEESFRINKHTLKMRPIFHWTPQRIESHIALCYMSFAVLRHIEYRVALTQKMSPGEILTHLTGVQASIMQHKKTKDLYRLPSSFRPEAQKIYKVFNLKRCRDAAIYIKGERGHSGPAEKPLGNSPLPEA